MLNILFFDDQESKVMDARNTFMYLTARWAMGTIAYAVMVAYTIGHSIMGGPARCMLLAGIPLLIVGFAARKPLARAYGALITYVDERVVVRFESHTSSSS